MAHINFNFKYSYYILILLTMSCGNKMSVNDNNTYPKVNWLDSGGFLIKRTMYDNIRIEREQFFTKDTVPARTDITYYLNGRVKSWKWYSKWYSGQPNAITCAIYYDSLGNFTKIGGCPFIGGIKIDDEYSIWVINPPQINSVAGIDKYVKGKKESSFYTEIMPYFDTMCIVVLVNEKDLHFDGNSKYIANYYILDGQGNAIARSEYGMNLLVDRFNIEKLPPFNEKMKILPVEE